MANSSHCIHLPGLRLLLEEIGPQLSQGVLAGGPVIQELCRQSGRARGAVRCARDAELARRTGAGTS